MTNPYIHRSLSCLDIITHASSFNRWEKMQRPTPQHYVEKDIGTFSFIQNIYLNFFFTTGLRNPVEEKAEKNVRARGNAGY